MKIVLASELPEADAELYDAFVASAGGGHYSQSRAWAEVADAGKSVQSAYFLAKDDGRVIGAARIQRAHLGPIPLPNAIIERGPVTETPEILEQILPALLHELRARAIARVTVMPYFLGDQNLRAQKILKQTGFRDVQKVDGAHVRTLRVDLRNKKTEDLFTGGERESLRRKLREAEKAGVRARAGNANDVRVLRNLHDEMMLAQGKGEKSPRYFDALARFTNGDRGAIFVAEHEQRSIAALFVIAHGAIATFVIGATSQPHLPFSKMARPMAEAIRWAHARGCDFFDLGGIPAENDADPKRRAIAQFKLDFSKAALDLVGEHARWF